MRRNWRMMTIAVLLLCASGIARAQSSQSGQGSQSQPAPQPSDKSKTPEITPLTLDAPAPVSADEDTAYKAFHDVPLENANKKIESGEAFLQKYPQSRYRSPVYVALVFDWFLALSNCWSVISAGLGSVGAISIACLEYFSALLRACAASDGLSGSLRGSVWPSMASVETSFGASASSFSPYSTIFGTCPICWHSNTSATYTGDL